MNWVRGRIIQIAIAMLMLGIPIVSLYTTIFSIKDCVLTLDQALSYPLCNEIQSHINAHQIPINRAMIDDLKKTFPILKTVTIKQRKSGVVHLTFIAHEPLFVVNDSKVLLPNNTLVERRCFRPDVLEPLSLFSVALTDTSSCPAGLAPWMQSMPSELIKNYEITWFDQTKIELIDKKNKKISILLQEKNRVDEALLDYCNSMILEVVQKKGISRTVVADLRFEGQLVLYSKRGNNEGKNVF